MDTIAFGGNLKMVPGYFQIDWNFKKKEKIKEIEKKYTYLDTKNLSFSKWIMVLHCGRNVGLHLLVPL